MSKASIFSIVLIVVVTLASALLMAFQQLHYWQLLAMKAGGVRYAGSGFLAPSIDSAIRSAAHGAFPLNIPGILRLATLLAGVGLIITTQNQLRAMKKILEKSTFQSKGHASA